MLLSDWLPLSEIPDQGLKFSFQDDSRWILMWEKFGLDCRMNKSLVSNLEVLPQPDGVYFRGRIQGQVSMICSRCLEPGNVNIDYSIDVYESFEADSQEPPGYSPLKFESGQWWFSPKQLAWEHFILALPDKPLCSGDCKGICPACGENINTGLCACPEESLDPRLAVFRNLKINR